MPLDHIARVGSLEEEVSEITKSFSTSGEGDFQRTPRAEGTCAVWV